MADIFVKLKGSYYIWSSPEQKYIDCASRSGFVFDKIIQFEWATRDAYVLAETIRTLRQCYGETPVIHWTEQAKLLYVNQYKHKQQTLRASQAQKPQRIKFEGILRQPFPYQAAGVEFAVKHQRVLIGDRPGLGKQQPIDSKVLTPNGWQEIGRLKTGDYVIGSNGQPTLVTGIFPQGIKDNYRVHFSDHSSVETGDDHLWTVLYSCGGRRWQSLTLTTKQLRTKEPLITKWNNGRTTTLDMNKTTLYLPMLSAPVQFAQQKALPIPAYTLGQLIANGGLGHSTPALVVNMKDAPEIEQSLLKDGMSFNKSSYDSSCQRFGMRGILKHIRALNLNVHSRHKFIPNIYKQASVSERIALFHGLMDGDGSITVTGNKIAYYTTSKQLAYDVMELVECLGGIASVRSYDRSKDHKPTDYQVRIRVPEWLAPFRIKRKLERYTPGRSTKPLRIVSKIEYSRTVESVCISVAAQDQLYVTEHCILTHNTIQSILAVHHTKAFPAIVVCPASLKRNWANEINMTLPDQTVHIINKNTPNQVLPDVNWYIISYDMLDEKPTLSQKDVDEELLRHILSSETPLCEMLRIYLNLSSTHSHMVKILNEHIKAKIYHKKVFKNVKLSPTTQALNRPKVKGYDLWILNRHLLQDAFPDYIKPYESKSLSALKDVKAETIIFDEFHYLKSDSSIRYKACEHLVKSFREHGTYMYGLTGTPIVNKPLDLLALLKILDRVKPFYSEWQFKLDHCGMVKTRWGWDASGASNLTQLNQKLRSEGIMIRRNTEDVLKELPPLRFQVVELPQDICPHLVRIETELENDYKTQVQSIKEKLEHAAGDLSQYQALTKELKDIEFLHLSETARLRKEMGIALLPYVQEHIHSFLSSSDEPLVIYGHHKDVLNPLEDSLKDYTISKIVGETISKDRQDEVDKFQNGETRVFIGSLAAAEGITLTKANTLVFAEFFWTPKDIEQIPKRLHRIGQTRPVLAQIFVVEGTISARMAKTVANKQTIIDESINTPVETAPVIQELNVTGITA